MTNGCSCIHTANGRAWASTFEVWETMRELPERQTTLTIRYINGLDVDASGALHVTWCYRDFVHAPRGGKPQQAGPNGPENVSSLSAYAVLNQNHDLCYAFSPLDEEYPGIRWLTVDGTPLRSDVGGVIVPRPETVIFHIPKYTGMLRTAVLLTPGILNQEAQCIYEGHLHVLNRENLDGVSTW